MTTSAHLVVRIDTGPDGESKLGRVVNDIVGEEIPEYFATALEGTLCQGTRRYTGRSFCDKGRLWFRLGLCWGKSSWKWRYTILELSLIHGLQKEKDGIR